MSDLGDVSKKELAGKELEILRNAGTDGELLGELEKIKLVNRALTKETELRTDRIIELEGNLEVANRDLNRTKIELNNMKNLYIKEQELKNLLENQISVLNQKSQAAFGMADISQYLTGVINDFNESVNTGDAAVNYIIRELDVEMKAHIAKTEDNRMLMTAPSLTSGSEDSLSMIRFSIVAAPKDIASYE